MIVGQLALALLQARVEVLDGLCVVLVLDAHFSQGKEGVVELAELGGGNDVGEGGVGGGPA